ncbi:hypothetical protein NADE_005085 [Nannochloris sp. 'desiccata']|nr:hypothetical protein KSW81_001952 [Chlorella desiccata (nom. nud.)]KAH7622500.1 hypothetical protein NADE_005085 [Chlorella desiccata (nom. nud.)]
MDDEDAFLAAKAAVDSILACEVSDSRQTTLYSAFRSILSFRLSITALSDSNVLLSSNLLLGGEVMFAPVESETSCAREVASQCRPSFVTGNNASRSSDLTVILNQEACKAFFCVPLPTNYQPSVGVQVSNGTVSSESVCLGAIIIGFQAENEVAEQDLRAALLIARYIAVNHHASLESLIAGIAPILSTRNDRNNHPGWGNAGGLLRTSQRERNAARVAAGGGAGGSRMNGNQASASTYIDNSNQSLDSADDTSDEDLSITETFSGSLVLNPIQHALLQSTRRLSLVFPQASLERQYQEWRSVRMARVDGAALATLLAYHFTRALANRNSTSSTDSTSIGGEGDGDGGVGGTVILSRLFPFIAEISRWEYLPCIIIIVPLLLALCPLTHRWYSQRRDVLVAFLYILLAWHHITAGAGIDGPASAVSASSRCSGDYEDSVSSSLFDIVAKQSQHLQHRGYIAPQALLSSTAILIEMMSSMDSIWISVLSIILNVRHPWQTLMLFIAATASLLVAPDVCPEGAAAAAWACWMAVAAKVVVAQLLMPGIAMYWLEYAARRAFCSTPAASYFAWRLERARSSARRRGRA